MLLDDVDTELDTALGPLRARSLRTTDAPALAAAVRGDMPRLGQHLHWPHRTGDEAGARVFLDRYLGPDDQWAGALGIWEGERLIGGVLLLGFDARHAVGELGVWVTARGAGTGAAAGACRVLVGAARRTLRLERIAWRAATDNPGSRRLAERLGFTLEGVARNDFVGPDGARHDTWVLALVGDELDVCARG